MKRFFLFCSLIAALSMAATAQRTPTMGWSSWNTFALNINEQLIRSQADAMHESGLQAAGYQYVNIDDGYWDGRAEDGQLRLNTTLFPSGMRALVDYIHGLGLKAGIYSDAGDNTCGSQGKFAWGVGVGLAGHEDEDCRLYFRDWDFDFIKVDYCGGAHMRLDEREQYTRISQAIQNCGKRGVVYNMCRWAFPGTWGADIADSWRTTGDIWDGWPSVRGILAENLYMSAYCHDGHYNDMDMLEVGRSMTQTEDETHFGMWCIMASPLLIGCDMTTLKDKPQTLALLTNRDLIALNQDPLHLQAYLADKQGECYLLVKDIKKLRGKERAVAIYNPSDEEEMYFLSTDMIDLGGHVTLYNCVTHEVEFGFTDACPIITVPAHGCKIFRAKGSQRLERTSYEAETAWLSRYQELRNNQAEVSAVYSASNVAEGGYMVKWLGNHADNDLQWRDVYSQHGGTYRITINYFCAEDRDIVLEVNGQQVGRLTTHSRDWNKQARISTTIRLRRGNNTIRLSNPDGWMPDIDGMKLEQL